MNRRREFEELDRVPWESYGWADMPTVMRALASPDPDCSDEAIEDLYDRALSQETVFPATVPAVPFIVRLAAAGIRTSALLYMLGRIAATDSEVDIPARAARDAVVAQLPLLLPLLQHEDAEVRQLAVWAVAQCRRADAAEAVIARWAVEQEQAVRADLLFGCALLDPMATRELVTEAQAQDQPDGVRIAAVIAGLQIGLAWTSQMAATTVSLLPAAERIEQTPWLQDPFPEIIELLLARGEREEAIALVDVALSAKGPVGDAARVEALWGAKQLGEEHPEACVRLLPAILPLLDEPETPAFDLIGTWSERNSAVVHTLVELASQEDAVPADRALAALISIEASQAPGLLAQDLRKRPRALAAIRVSEAGGLFYSFRQVECDPLLLVAVRARLSAGDIGVGEAGDLLGLLENWGPAARSALPELLATLPRFPLRVPGVLAQVVAGAGADHAAAVEALRREAAQGGGAEGREAVLEALRKLTGGS